MGNRWGNSGNSVRLYFLGSQKSLQMVTAAMKLKDAYSLEGKLCLLFNMLSGFVIAFLPRSKCLLVSWLQSPSAVIFGAPQNKVNFLMFKLVLACCDSWGCKESDMTEWLNWTENKVSHCFYCFPIYFPWSDGTRWHDLRFLMLNFKPAFSLSSFTFIKRLFSSS